MENANLFLESSPENSKRIVACPHPGEPSVQAESLLQRAISTGTSCRPAGSEPLTFSAAMQPPYSLLKMGRPLPSPLSRDRNRSPLQLQLTHQIYYIAQPANPFFPTVL